MRFILDFVFMDKETGYTGGKGCQKSTVCTLTCRLPCVQDVGVAEEGLVDRWCQRNV